MPSRLQKLRTLMNNRGINAVLISSTPNIIYLTQFNHFSTEEREAYLLITKQNAYILTDRRYTHAVQTYVKDFELLEIFYGHGFADIIKAISSKEHIEKLGIEENNLTHQEYKKIAPFIKEVTHFDLSPLRIVKDEDELTALKKACAVGDEIFTQILSELKPGVTEKEIALKIEILAKQNDATLSFDSIVAFDANAAFVHHKTGNQTLQKNSVVLMDFGIKYHNYCSDMSRTVFLGKASSVQRKAYQFVLDAQNLAAEYIEKKLTTGKEVHGADADKVARDYLIKHGYDSFPHGLGHGVGLQVHEPPSVSPPSTSVLQSGMVFSNEPGIYLPHKFGIRIEDLYTIQGQKLIHLTKASRDIIEL